MLSFRPLLFWRALAYFCRIALGVTLAFLALFAWFRSFLGIMVDVPGLTCAPPTEFSNELIYCVLDATNP